MRLDDPKIPGLSHWTDNTPERTIQELTVIRDEWKSSNTAYVGWADRVRFQLKHEGDLWRIEASVSFGTVRYDSIAYFHTAHLGPKLRVGDLFALLVKMPTCPNPEDVITGITTEWVTPTTLRINIIRP